MRETILPRRDQALMLLLRNLTEASSHVTTRTAVQISVLQLASDQWLLAGHSDLSCLTLLPAFHLVPVIIRIFGLERELHRGAYGLYKQIVVPDLWTCTSLKLLYKL